MSKNPHNLIEMMCADQPISHPDHPHITESVFNLYCSICCNSLRMTIHEDINEERRDRFIEHHRTCTRGE